MPHTVANRAKLHVVVSGRVQGIGYRWFVQRTGAGLGLAGWVRNLPGGSVETEATGRKEDIDTFLHELKNGHPYALVTAVDTEWLPPDNDERTGFEIRH